MELSTEELQYLINAIDTHVRNNGLNVAAAGANLGLKIQNEANNKNKQPDTDEKS